MLNNLQTNNINEKIIKNDNFNNIIYYTFGSIFYTLEK